MRAVIYARYSTDMQREASIEDQVRVCTALATRMGATVAEVFTDYGVSGSTQLRPGFQNLLAAISSGSADLIIAEALDRISRDQEHIAAFFKQVRFGNVTLVTVSEGEISELHVGLKGTMNALFLKDLGLKTHRGIEGRVRQGRSGGGKAYGYSVVRELDARGDPIRGGRVINPDEAAIVIRIFSDFVVGHSPRAIARALNAEGIPGPNGEAWQDTTIRGHAERGTGILRNALYAGQLIWNRQRYIKDPTTGNRVSRLNPRSAWITHDVPDLRIIDPDLWDKVQARLAGIRQSDRAIKVRETQFWKHRRPRHLLTGKAFCGNCGGSLSAIGKDYLACATARNKGTCTSKRGVRREMVENQILDALRTQLMQPDLVREFSTAFIAEINHQRARLERDRAGLERELAQVNAKLVGLIDAIADGLRGPGLQQQLDDLEARKTALQSRIDEPFQPMPRLHPNLAELYRAKVADLHLALADPATRTEAIEIIRSLISRVEVHPVATGGFEIELTGEIARMLALASGPDTQKTAPNGTAVRGLSDISVKVVAGIGFEPMTFRL